MRGVEMSFEGGMKEAVRERQDRHLELFIDFVNAHGD
jgi:hypothetical protein